MKYINDKYNQILKDQENMKLKNDEFSQNLLNANNEITDLNNQIGQNQTNIDDIKNNYIQKTNLKDVSDKIVNINNDINELQETYKKNKDLLDKAYNEIKDLNKTMTLLKNDKNNKEN